MHNFRSCGSRMVLKWHRILVDRPCESKVRYLRARLHAAGLLFVRAGAVLLRPGTSWGWRWPADLVQWESLEIRYFEPEYLYLYIYIYVNVYVLIVDIWYVYYFYVYTYVLLRYIYYLYIYTYIYIYTSYNTNLVVRWFFMRLLLDNKPLYHGYLTRPKIQPIPTITMDSNLCILQYIRIYIYITHTHISWALTLV